MLFTLYDRYDTSMGYFLTLSDPHRYITKAPNEETYESEGLLLQRA